MTVKNIARTDVITVHPTAPIQSVAELMADKGVGSIVVVEDDAPIGLITDRDIGLEIWEHDDLSSVTVEDLMTTDPVTIEADTEIYEALQTARDAKVRRLPITENGNLTGIVTLDDVIVLLAGELSEVSNVIQGHSPPY